MKCIRHQKSIDTVVRQFHDFPGTSRCLSKNKGLEQ
jgi:hypothetical protein